MLRPTAFPTTSTTISGSEIFSPSLYQLFAISMISDYRMADWLRVFGFDLEEIPRLQIALPTNRTILLDSSLSDPDAWIPWFRNRSNDP